MSNFASNCVKRFSFRKMNSYIFARNFKERKVSNRNNYRGGLISAIDENSYSGDKMRGLCLPESFHLLILSKLSSSLISKAAVLLRFDNCETAGHTGVG